MSAGTSPLEVCCECPVCVCRVRISNGVASKLVLAEKRVSKRATRSGCLLDRLKGCACARKYEAGTRRVMRCVGSVCDETMSMQGTNERLRRGKVEVARERGLMLEKEKSPWGDCFQVQHGGAEL